MAQIGAIGQGLLTGHAHVLFHPPQQVRACSRASCHNSKPKKFRSARQSMPSLRHGSTALANVISPCPVTIHLAAEQHVGAVLQQGYKANLRISAGTAAGPRTRESIFVDLLVGHVEGAAIQAHQPPLPVPGAPRIAHGDRLNQLIVQLPHRLPTQPRAGLRDPRLARHPHSRRWIAKPLHPFQQTAQYLAIGRLHIQSQSDHIVDNHRRRKIALTNAGLARPRQHRSNGRIRKRFGDDTKTDVVRDPRTRGSSATVRANCGLLSLSITECHKFR